MITRHYTFSTQKYSVLISIDVILFVTGNCFIVSDALVQRIVRYIFGMLNLNGDEFVIVGDGLYNSDKHPQKRYPFPPGHGAHLNCFEEMHHLYAGEAVLTDCLLC